MLWKSARRGSAPTTSAAHAEHLAHCSALCCAEKGEEVFVHALLGEAGEAGRLREMGVCEGARVQVLRGGNPLVVRVADSRLGLAHAVAERVLVAVEAPSEEALA